jgi:Carboxypeptidase regulatory-like domain
MFAQEESTRGKVIGIVRDPAGNAVVGASVQIFSQVHDTRYELTTDDKGRYETTWLYEGLYVVRIEARNFLIDNFTLDVKIAQVTNGDRKLTAINPGKPTIASHVDMDRMAGLPIDGRDPLNAAKFEPEVLPQDAGRLDPTKSGSFALSIDKLSGLDSRYKLDGVEMNDETHGNSIQNIALSSVNELTVTQALRDVSTGLSSSGAVLMTTRSGAEDLHGEGFGFLRVSPIGFAATNGGQDPNYSREDLGGRVGGGLLENKLFYFVDAEFVHLDAKQGVVAPYPFQALTGRYSSPFRNTSTSGRLDWNFNERTHGFYRFAYNLNSSIDNFGQGYALFDNRTHSPSNAFGVDYTNGNNVHSFRFGYFNYHNSLQATASPAGLPNLPANLRFSDVNGGALQFGPSPFAPQESLQRNIEGRYDRVKNDPIHTLRFGASVTSIAVGGYANHYGLAPQITTALGNGLDPNPTDYPVLAAMLSDGQQYATEHSGFGFPHGEQSDIRFQAYVTGAYRLYPNLTLTWGTSYVFDTGKTNSDLSEIPCSAIVATLPTATRPCNGQSLLMDTFDPGFGAQVTRPLTNFGPQLGVAWDPYRNGRTIIRGGGGVFFDTSLFSNVGLDRSVRLSQGAYAATNALTCPGGVPATGTAAVYFPTASGLSQAVTSIDGKDLATQVCGQPAGAVAGAISDLQKSYQQAVSALGGANPYFVGRTLGISNAVNGLSAFQSDYRLPRSYQMNIGVQRQTWRGGVATADYVRNVSERFGLIEDVNHVGDDLYLNNDAALNAITRTLGQRAPTCLPGVPLTVGAISQNAVTCYIAAVPGASINDFAANGLDSGTAYLAGQAASIARGVGPNQGAAFSGVNPFVGSGTFQAAVGHSVYNGFQGSLKQDLSIPYFAFKAETFRLTYTLSKFSANGGDNPSQANVPYDFRDGALYRGPTSLDRRHQINLAGTLDTRWGPRILYSLRIASPAPSVLTLAAPSGNPLTTPGEIFRTDFTGDGTPGDIFPPHINSSGFNPPGGNNNIYSAISKYNATQAGVLTPAGQELVTEKVLSASQLSVLQAVTPFVALPPLNQVSNPWFRSFDTAVTWPLHWRDSILIEPRISFYNLFNFSSFDPLSGQLSYYFPNLSQVPLAGVGSANGTPSGAPRDVLRTGFGTGVYNAGAPRQMEFGVKVTF